MNILYIFIILINICNCFLSNYQIGNNIFRLKRNNILKLYDNNNNMKFYMDNFSNGSERYLYNIKNIPKKEYENNYLDKISKKRDINTNSINYLKNINKKDNKSFCNKINKITFDKLLMNNYDIDCIYKNKKENIIIEFKNNSRYIYYYDNNEFIIDKIIEKVYNIINLEDYPYYIINSPYGFLNEKK